MSEVSEFIENVLKDLQKVTRITVVTSEGRVFEQFDAYKTGVQLVLQDDGRTLKIFPKGYGYDERLHTNNN